MRGLVGIVGGLVLVATAAAAEPTQRELEAKFVSHLDPARLRDNMQLLTARPHHVGSPYGKTNAHWMAEQFRSWGYDARLEVFHVLFPTPTKRVLEMVSPTTYRASLVEPALEEDKTSSQQSEQLPPYNAYSPDGNVTAPLVYVNYGVPEDYLELERRGISVEGKIVIARYGRSWRGIKPKVAAEKGAVGCLLYSDPRDDGYYQGDVYPRGSFKNRHGVQRGSVADMPLYPGDPLTPKTGATKNAKRLKREEAPTLARIPVLPISYADAQPLLEALEGPVAPPDWRGALPITYHIGPGPAEVHLELEFSWDIVPAYNVIAAMKGSRFPDEWILRGNHHDAWVNGADDPISGMVALMEEARAIGMLVKDGFRPKRTLIYAAWDAEEPGLLGSTEWVEHHANALAERAVVYINTDSNGRGFLGAGGSHTLEKIFNSVAADVRDPQTDVSVLERRRARIMVRGSRDERLQARDTDRLRLSALGSGSDYTPFLQHLGIASLNLGYGGENRGGEYHSAYDSFDHYIRFGDPQFAYGVTLAETTGRLVLRLSEAEILPFDFTMLTRTLADYSREIGKLLDGMREDTELENLLIREDRYRVAADPTQSFVAPQPKEPVPHLNLAPLNNELTELNRSVQRWSDAALLSGDLLDDRQKTEINRLLLGTERVFIREQGLPGRDWFRHHLYAPGYYTGYGVKTLPGVREAIEQRDWELADEQILVLADVLARLTAHVDAISAILESAAQTERP